jgi:cytochrome c553
VGADHAPSERRRCIALPPNCPPECVTIFQRGPLTSRRRLVSASLLLAAASVSRLGQPDGKESAPQAHNRSDHLHHDDDIGARGRHRRRSQQDNAVDERKAADCGECHRHDGTRPGVQPGRSLLARGPVDSMTPSASAKGRGSSTLPSRTPSDRESLLWRPLEGHLGKTVTLLS